MSIGSVNIGIYIAYYKENVHRHNVSIIILLVFELKNIKAEKVMEINE